ncbi:MAG: hypothetical protein NTZ74_02555 [Chloroflexi bacterium]|nr:hypothetical protein [Chloroflexota bacterium]
MNYQEFRELWHKALKASHLQIPYPICPTEKIDLTNMNRSYELILYGGPDPKSDPFRLSATITWDWDATLSARYATTEEDMLMQIFGDFGLYDDDTVPPWLRMDVLLTASLPYGRVYPMPAMTQWQPWFKQANDELQLLLPMEYEMDGLYAYSDPIQPNIELLEDGQLNLERVTFKAWQLIELPRQWDDPEKRDPYPEGVLCNFANQIAKAMDDVSGRIIW